MSMTRSFVFHVWTLGIRTRRIFISFHVKRRPLRSSLADWNRGNEEEKETSVFVSHRLNATHVVGPAQWGFGWSDVIIHTCSQFLPSCCMAWLQFQCTHTCSLPYLLILWSYITSTVKELGERFQGLLFFPFHSSGLWGEKIAVQTTDVRSDPRPPLPFFKEWYVPNPLTQLNKGDLLQITLEVFSFSCDSSDCFHMSVCCWRKLLIPKCASGSGVLTLLSTAVMGSRLWPYPLWEVTNEHACLCVCMPVHTPSHQKVSHTGLATWELLRRQENRLITH